MNSSCFRGRIFKKKKRFTKLKCLRLFIFIIIYWLTIYILCSFMMPKKIIFQDEDYNIKNLPSDVVKNLQNEKIIGKNHLQLAFNHLFENINYYIFKFFANFDTLHNNEVSNHEMQLKIKQNKSRKNNVLYNKDSRRNSFPPVKIYDSNGMSDYDPSPTGEEILLLTMYNSSHDYGIPNHNHMLLSNRNSYCKSHGYSCDFVDTSKLKIEKNKHISLFIDTIRNSISSHPEAEWIWILSDLAIIMVANRKLAFDILSNKALENHIIPSTFLARSCDLITHTTTSKKVIPNDIDYIFTQDFAGLTIGSFFLRTKSKNTQKFLSLWENYIQWENSDVTINLLQDTLISLILENEEIRKHLGIVPQRQINSYPTGSVDMKYQFGDLLVHLAGCWTKNSCKYLWSQYWQKKSIQDCWYLNSETISNKKRWSNCLAWL